MELNREYNANLLNFQNQQDRNLELEYKQYLENYMKELCSSGLVIVVLFLLLYLSDGNNCGEDIRLVVIIAILLKSVILLPLEFLFLVLLKGKVVRVATVKLIKLIMVFCLLGWYIFVTKRFFSNNTCKTESNPLYIASLILVIEAILIFMLTSILSCIIMCLLCVMCVIYKTNQEERNKNLMIKDVLLNVASLRLTPAQFSKEDSCSICLEDYAPDQQVIRLPCNDKHYFHSSCIAEWISRKSF